MMAGDEEEEGGRDVASNGQSLLRVGTLLNGLLVGITVNHKVRY